MSVEGQQDCSDADKKRMLLSAETRLGLRMTGMYLALVITHYSLFITSESISGHFASWFLFIQLWLLWAWCGTCSPFLR